MPPRRCAHSPLTEPASPCCRHGWSTRTSSAVRCGSCCQAGKPSRWPSTHCTVGSTAGRRAYGPSSSTCGPHTGAAAGGELERVIELDEPKGLVELDHPLEFTP